MELSTEVVINAPASTVWDILTDFGAFPQWNPFIRIAAGEIREGNRIEVVLQIEGGKPMRFQPRLLRVNPARELRWLGRLGIPRLFDGEHIFLLEPVGDRSVRFIQKEVFRGLFVPLFSRGFWERTRHGFEVLNHELKNRAESFAASVPAPKASARA